MSDPRKILILGGGPAGVWAAIAAKKRDPAAEVTLVSSELCEPYEKPPLSKGILTGKLRIEEIPIAGPKGCAGHGVTPMLGEFCEAIDRDTRKVITASGKRLPYDALVIATGSRPHELPQFPVGMPRVHYLRTEAHAHALKAELAAAKSLVVIGAGLIGLEVASSARVLGVPTVVLEVAPRILARVTDADTGARLHAAHTRHGVDIRLNTRIAAVRSLVDGRVAIDTGGKTLYADIIVVGAGATADDKLAVAAGLACDNGIVVDQHCRTSDPAIFAAGDVVRFPGPHGLVRLEDWRHAQDQGTVAGVNAAGGDDTYRPVPSFWSEQYDLYLQCVGWAPPRPERYLHRPMAGNASLVFQIDGANLVYALGINAQREIATTRRLIERRVPVAADDLANPAKPLADLLKAKA
jgi:NADPH-dependent 2,4-dienoyl-CoA reductase/sulfur reductase-like enzyme